MARAGALLKGNGGTCAQRVKIYSILEVQGSISTDNQKANDLSCKSGILTTGI